MKISEVKLNKIKEVFAISGIISHKMMQFISILLKWGIRIGKNSNPHLISILFRASFVIYKKLFVVNVK